MSDVMNPKLQELFDEIESLKSKNEQLEQRLEAVENSIVTSTE